MASLLSIGVQAVRANQAALGVVGNNISNVNTPGYTRQIPQFQSELGGGVRQESTQRIADKFITARVWADNSRFEAAKYFEGLANQLDNTLASDSTSLSLKLDDYFAALQGANDDPSSLTNRELFVAEANATVRRYNDLYQRISEQSSTINTRIRELAEEITSQSKQIADYNDRIRIAQAAGKESFELLDQRDAAIKELSSLIDIRVIDQPTGEVSIFIGNGQPLVIGQTSNPLVARPNEFEPSQYDVGVVIANRFNSLDGLISTGQLGGVLEYRDDVLNKSLDELGRLAIIFADTMNEQHLKGMDLDGNMGKLLFRDVNDGALVKSRLQSEFADGGVRITDSSKLLPSDYKLVFTSSETFRLTRLSDGASWTQASFNDVGADINDVDSNKDIYFDPASGDLRLEIDGFRLDINKPTPFVTNETMLVKPVRTGAEDMRLDISSGRQLALASPVSIAAEAGNTGTGAVTVKVSEVNPLQSTPESALSNLLLSDTNFYIRLTKDSSNPDEYSAQLQDEDGNAPPLLPPPPMLTVDATDPRSLVIRNADPELPGELVVSVQGVPNDGDEFTINFNFEVDGGDKVNIGISDNRNGVMLSDLMRAKTSLEGSYQDTYGRLVERVGITTRVAQMDRQASESVLKNSINQREETSGVNLDEEAVRLIQFQQAYQAAAQLITASQRTFDALINSI
ncbi:flagellar hook-associated protein FlgK [Nitrincola alkalilacustris]|uniref:flagellar hook-associated protein FlgK n=1 Tax=Nitrincola alkalilacustris TaxID=1571224 RepID=UPI00124EB673|nr:flagellar hook-associated protein FlgK [Nitrincola alkalilacustris]